MASVAEEDLRAAREEVIDRHCELQGLTGSLPSRRAAEDFAQPVMEKVARDCEETPSPVASAHADDGWLGEKDHSPRMPEAREGETVRTFSRPVGTVRIDRATGMVHGAEHLRIPKRADVLGRSKIGHRIRHAIRQSWSDIDWQIQWQRIFWMSSYSPSQRVSRALELADRWFRDHDEPGRPREPAIIVGG